MGAGTKNVFFIQTLRLSQTVLGGKSPSKLAGSILNEGRFESMAQCIHCLWTAPIVTIVIGFILWFYLRWAGLFGMILIFGAMLIQCEFGDKLLLINP